jgi:glycosyl transferase family 25
VSVPPIFVISLRDATRRRASVAEQMAAQGLDFSFFDAVDGRARLPRDLEVEVDRAGTVARIGRTMTDAEYACALSHRAIYRRAIDRAIPRVVVLEDDAVLHPRFGDFLRDGGADRAALVLLEHRRSYVRRGGPETNVAGIELRRPVVCPCGGGGYALTPDFAARLLAASTPVTQEVDWPLDLTRADVLMTEPRLVRHARPDDGLEPSHLGSDRRRAIDDASDLKLGDIKRSPRRFRQPAYWRQWVGKRIVGRKI